MKLMDVYIAGAGRLEMLFNWNGVAHHESIHIRKNDFTENYLSAGLGISYFSFKLNKSFEIDDEKFKISTVVDFQRYEIYINVFHYNKKNEANAVINGSYPLRFLNGFQSSNPYNPKITELLSEDYNQLRKKFLGKLDKSKKIENIIKCSSVLEMYYT